MWPSLWWFLHANSCLRSLHRAFCGISVKARLSVSQTNTQQLFIMHCECVTVCDYNANNIQHCDILQHWHIQDCGLRGHCLNRPDWQGAQINGFKISVWKLGAMPQSSAAQAATRIRQWDVLLVGFYTVSRKIV